MKRFLCLALCVLTAVFVCACDDGKPSGTIGTEAAASTGTAVPETAAAATTDVKAEMKAFLERFDDTQTVGDKLVYKDANITVTVHGINYATVEGPELHLTINNNYGKDITVQAPYAVINGYMITPKLKIDVPRGKSASGNLCLSYFNLAIADITVIRNIEFSLSVMETDSYNPVFSTELISVPTSAAPEEQPAYDENGQLVYDENDIKIILKGVNTDRAYSDGAELTVYMVNGTDRSVAVRTGSVRVNGYEMTSVMNRTLLSGKHAVDVVTFYRQDMDEYAIDTIDSVNVSFEIKDAETWESIDTTGDIAVSLDAPKPADLPPSQAGE